MRLVPTALLLLPLGCGSPTEVLVDRGATHAPVAEPSAPRPAPGVDLSGPIAIPQRDDTRSKAPAVPLDLTADRAVIRVAVPIPPRGGAVGFQFNDDRQGWVARIPDANQIPTVAYGNDKIYVSGGFEAVSFYALDATSGRIEWATTNLEDNGPTSAVIDDDNVLFNTESCTLFSLDAKTGKRQWLRYLGDPTLTQIAVADGLVFASHPDGGGQSLSAYRTKTGDPVWSRGVGSELLVTPVIAGDSVYASTIGGTTYRFLRQTGKLVWQKQLRATTAPWIVGDELFVSRRAGKKEQQIVVSTETGTIIREHQVSSGAYLADVPYSLDDWKAVWAFEGSRPVVDRGIRYVAMGSEVHASDAQTGETIWHRRYEVKPDKRALGSVAIAGSAVVVSSRDGKLFGLDVDTGYTLWSYDIGHRVVAEPIVAKGWVYAATEDGYVIALNVADKSLDGWHMFGGNAQKNGLVVPPAPPRSIELDQTEPAPAVEPIEPVATRDDTRAAFIARRAHPHVTLSEECRTNALCKE